MILFLFLALHLSCGGSIAKHYFSFQISSSHFDAEYNSALKYATASLNLRKTRRWIAYVEPGVAYDGKIKPRGFMGVGKDIDISRVSAGVLAEGKDIFISLRQKITIEEGHLVAFFQYPLSASPPRAIFIVDFSRIRLKLATINGRSDLTFELILKIGKKGNE